MVDFVIMFLYVYYDRSFVKRVIQYYHYWQVINKLYHNPKIARE